MPALDIAPVDQPHPSRAAVVAWGLPTGITSVWVVVVVAAGLGGRVLDHWESSLTMLFGSFLSGSSPLGGGAVAFPVFTKLLDVPAPVARSFALAIQSLGMSVAAVAILTLRRPVHRRAIVLGAPAAIVGFLTMVAVTGRSDVTFWPSSIGAAWVKATVSIVLATTSLLMLLHVRRHTDHAPLPWNHRLDVGLVVAAVAGGALSSIAGTGANIAVFLFLVVLADVDPRMALLSAVIVMATVSVTGLILFGVVDGQLDVTVAGDAVTAVGGRAVDLDAATSDLFGLWMAAVPVVVWGAPLGSWAASIVREHRLVVFIALLAAAEVLSTVWLVPELREETALATYLLGGLLVVPWAFVALRQRRHRVFA